MNRLDAALYLQSQLGSLFTEVGIEFGDPAVLLSDVVDDALLMTGVSYADLAAAEVASVDVPGFRAVLRYVGLRYVYDNALNRVDTQISDPNVSKNWSQFVRQLENSVKSALAAAEPHISGQGSEAFATGTIVFGDRTIPPGVSVEQWAW